MRRVLLGAVIAVGIPAVVVAITTTAGQLVEVNNFNTTTGYSYINEAMCAGANVDLQWTVTGSVAFETADTFRVFASNKPPPTTGDTAGLCAEQDSPTDGTQAGQVGSVSSPTTTTGTLSVLAANIATETGIPCTIAQENTPVYLCTHWKNGTTNKGQATGTFLIQVVAPDAPAGVTVQPGNEKLVVRWTANDETPTAATRYEARAYEGTATTPASTASSTGTTATIKGLANGTTYDVRVVAFSIGGNPSGESAGVPGAPVPTAGFWDVYESSGGVEQGGCASGPGGVLALLGVASLLAFRRRKP